MEVFMNEFEESRNLQYPENNKPVSIGEWIWSLILVGLPLINIVVLLIWVFDSNTNRCKSNWAKAQLILMIIGLVFTGLFWGVFGVAMLSVLQEMNF
jgi:hypothetical protein